MRPMFAPVWNAVHRLFEGLQVSCSPHPHAAYDHRWAQVLRGHWEASGTPSYLHCRHTSLVDTQHWALPAPWPGPSWHRERVQGVLLVRGARVSGTARWLDSHLPVAQAVMESSLQASILWRCCLKEVYHLKMTLCLFWLDVLCFQGYYFLNKFFFVTFENISVFYLPEGKRILLGQDLALLSLLVSWRLLL